MIYIVIGVQGSGKTTIGKLLASKLGLQYYEGDDFHPKANIEKMKKGIPLTDEDRVPWLDSISIKILGLNESVNAVIACSALKESYRKILTDNSKLKIHFIYLKGSKKLILKRILKRDHYMPKELLESQFDCLQEPDNATIVSIDNSPEIIVQEIIKKIN